MIFVPIQQETAISLPPEKAAKTKLKLIGPKSRNHGANETIVSPKAGLGGIFSSQKLHSLFSNLAVTTTYLTLISGWEDSAALCHTN